MLLERESAIDDFTLVAGAAFQSGKVLLVSGEAGIGKTALLEYMRARLDVNFSILWSGCDPLFTPRPYAPLHDFAKFLSVELSTLLESNDSPSKVSNEIATTLYSNLECLEKPILLVIEDVHWADHATLDLLKFLVRRISFTKCMLCLSYRDDEVTFEHPLSSVLNLTPSAHTHRISLHPLSFDAVESLSKNTVHNADNLYKVTAGNPFFITEILASRATQEQPIPLSIRGAIGTRLHNLGVGERTLLQTLSLIPYSIPVLLIEHLFSEHGETYAMACVARKLLQCDAKGEFRFRHELARLAILDSISVVEQKRTHARILASLEELSLTNSLAWLAHHAQGAFDATSVLKYAPLAASGAANLGAHKEAASYYEKALQFVEYADTELAATLYENWAYEVGLTTHIKPSVIDARRSAITLWRALGRNDKIGENLRWLSRLYWYQGQAERAEHYANDAIKIFEKMPASCELAMAYSLRAQIDMLNDRAEEAVLWGNKALALEQKFNNPAVRVHALTNIGTALLMKGDVAGEAMLKESLTLSLKHGMHEETARVYTNYSDYCVRFKLLSLAEELTATGIQFDSTHDLDSWTYYLVGIQAQLRLEQGRLIEAETIAVGVLSLENQTLLMKLPALIVLARARLRMTDTGRDNLLQQALGDALATEENQYIIPVRLSIIEQSWVTGNPELACEHIKSLSDLSPGILNVWQLGELLTWIARMGLSVPKSLSSASEYQPIPLAYRHELAGNIETAYEVWLSLDMPFNAAVCLLQTQGEERQSAFVRASLYLGQMQANAVLIRLKQLASEEGFGHLLPKTPRGPYSRARQHPAGLTPKEQEVVKLLAAGASNQDIASTLSRSQRTIENHVSSILAKLNVENRIEAMLRVQNEPWLANPP